TDATAWATVENNVATFTAEVYNDKYEFVGWTNGTETVSNDLVYTVTLTKNLELVANFQEKATEPEAPAYDWAGEYTVNATVADETDNWTTPSPLTMKIFYDEAAAAYKLESFAGADIKAASGAYGYYPTVSVSADNSRVATININSGIYLASEAVMGDEIWSKSTLLRAKDGSQTVTLTVDENGVMSIPDMEIVYDVLLSDFTTHQITVLSTLTGVTATKPGSVVEPEPEPEGLADGVYNIHWEWNERGYLAYHPDYPNEAKLAGVTLSGYQSSHYALDAEGVDINWYLITAKDGNRYLFHVATGKFLNYSNEAADEAKANMLSSQEALAITISESTADPASHTITAIVDGSMKFLSSGCGQPTAQHPVRWYYDGNAETDGGTPLKFKKVDGVVVSDEVMAAVEAVINNEGTTGINGVDAENGEQAIYDITGRKIEEITAPGIYIVNGRKVLVK
ncbi:MAG: hypothetical protein IKJ31_07215, partial [Bacteroidaceae bacterium]|nr:hypothetical protein [Bacteroidaceae bacterium]